MNILINNSFVTSEFNEIAFSAYWSREIFFSSVIKAPIFLDAKNNTASIIADFVSWFDDNKTSCLASLLILGLIPLLISGAKATLAKIGNANDKYKNSHFPIWRFT